VKLTRAGVRAPGEPRRLLTPSPFLGGGERVGVRGCVRRRKRPHPSSGLRPPSPLLRGREKARDAAFVWASFSLAATSGDGFEEAPGGTRVSRVVSGVSPGTRVGGVVGGADTRWRSCARGSGGTPNPTRGTRVPPDPTQGSAAAATHSGSFNATVFLHLAAIATTPLKPAGTLVSPLPLPPHATTVPSCFNATV